MSSSIRHTTIQNNKLLCLHCGGEHPLQFPLAIPAMTKMIDAFNVLHEHCKKTWQRPAIDPSSPIELRIAWWITHGEVGLSSKTIWLFFTNTKNNSIDPMHNYPHDPDDFKRCYQLLQLIPEWRGRLHEMRYLSTPWSNLIQHWDMLSDMFERNEKSGWVKSNQIDMVEFMNGLTTQ